MNGAPKTWIALVLTLALLAPLAPELGRAPKSGMCCKVQAGACRCPKPMGLSGVCAMKSSCGSETPTGQVAPDLTSKGLPAKAVVAQVNLVPDAEPLKASQLLASQAVPKPPEKPPRLLG